MDYDLSGRSIHGVSMAEERITFIRSVYAWLMGGFAVAGLGALSAPFIGAILFPLMGRFFFYGLLFAQMGAVLWAGSVSARKPQNRYAYALFTFLSGIIAGLCSLAVAQQSGPGTVLAALAMTTADFLLLTGVAFVSKRDFSFLRSFIAVGFGIAIVAIIANFFFQVEGVSLLISAVIAIAASAKVLWDTSAMLRTGRFGDPAGIALSFFVSFYQIFLSLLNLLGGRRR